MTDQPRKPWLWAGVAVPLIYYGNMIVSAMLYPGYSHMSQYVSELGSASATRPEVFNITTMVLGLVALVAGLALGRAAARVGSKGWGWAAGIATALFGVALVMGGLFPLPDPRHNGFGLGIGVQLAPLFLALALRRTPLRALRVFLYITFVVSLVLFVVMMSGGGGLVTRENVGMVQRLFSLTVFPWIGVASFALLRGPSPTPTATQS